MQSKGAVTVLASVARTATTAPVTINTPRASGVIVNINVTATAATPSVVVNVCGVDPLSESIYTILDSVAITAAGLTTLRIGPALPTVANVAANDLIPEQMTITVTHGDADSITYSVSLLRIE